MKTIFCFLLIAAVAVQIRAMPADAAKPAAPAAAAAAAPAAAAAAKPAAAALGPKSPLSALPPLDPKAAMAPLAPLVKDITKVGTDIIETGEKCLGSFFGLGKLFGL